MTNLVPEQPGPEQPDGGAQANPEPKYSGRFADLYKKSAQAVMERTGSDLQVRGGDFLDVDGTRFVQVGDLERYNEIISTRGWYGGARDFEAGILPHDHINLPMDSSGSHRDGLVGKFGMNNGLIQYVDAAGRIHVGYITEENIEALKAAGYEHTSNFPVGLSIAESRFVNPTNEYGSQYYGREAAEAATEELNRNYQAMLERGHEKSKQEITAKHLAEYQRIAEEKGVRPLAGGDFMTVDGVEYEWHGRRETHMVVPLNTDGYNMSRTPEQVGTFNANNSMLAFVDGEGRMNVGYDTAENRQALEDARYKLGKLGIPLSNGELPTDEEVKARFLQLQERGRLKAEEERKAAEQQATS